MNCSILGIPVQSGASQAGCIMGPDAYRTAGILKVIEELGHTATDHGDLSASPADLPSHPNTDLKRLDETVGWIDAIQKAATALPDDALRIFLGGDHSMAAGTVPAMAAAAQRRGRRQFVLWLDAHSDIHTLETTGSGNLHGTPLGYFIGLEGFAGYYPDLEAMINPTDVCMMGIRSVDDAERKILSDIGVAVHDMRWLDEHGVVAPIRAFLERVAEAGGDLHVSLDVDFLEPAIAPAVGTTVPGGTTIREAHLIMEMLCDSGLVTSLDLAELNPFLDERGRTANLMVDLCASLLGRKILDKPTQSY